MRKEKKLAEPVELTGTMVLHSRDNPKQEISIPVKDFDRAQPSVEGSLVYRKNNEVPISVKETSISVKRIYLKALPS